MEVIANDDGLYRRVAPDHANTDGTVNSAAYKPKEGMVSVDLARLTTPLGSLKRAERLHFGLGELFTRVPRGLGLSVEHNPLPANPAHSLLQGKFNKATRRLLAEATLLILPVGPKNLILNEAEHGRNTET